MPTFKVSQAERWHRTYVIEADTMEEAKRIYERYTSGLSVNAEDADAIYDNSPEYLEDLDGDVEWYAE